VDTVEDSVFPSLFLSDDIFSLRTEVGLRTAEMLIIVERSGDQTTDKRNSKVSTSIAIVKENSKNL
jgi:hypothetical protein